MTNGIGKNIPRKEAFDKVTGSALYTGDIIPQRLLHAKILTSPHTHAHICAIDVRDAKAAKGVLAVITGDFYPRLVGTLLNDRPPIAIDKVRYYGEPVALVVAKSEDEAMLALKLIHVEYELLPNVNSVSDALKENAPLIHENLTDYNKTVTDIYPQNHSNICDLIKIRKGDIARGFSDCDVVIEEKFYLPQSDHVAMETRNARCEILPDGRVFIDSSTQSPFAVKKLISDTYNIPEGNVIIKVPFVGGGFGGKAPITIEILAYLASLAVGGRLVRVANSREEDIKTYPCKMGLEATIKLGATRDGFLKVMDCQYLVDTGAYSNIGPRLAKAIAVDCSGPYNIETISCDSLCVYTNHTYATSYRGFSHTTYTFCLERTIEKLAKQIGMDSFEIRFKNLLVDGDQTPTQVKATKSNIGNLNACLVKLKEMINWDEGNKLDENGYIKAKGISCFWKTSDSPTSAISGVTLTFNSDGSININCGAVEIGPGTKTTACQILAEKMKMEVNRIFIKMEVDTEICPEHWKTVASMTTFMLGRAILKAADDLIRQLKSLAGTILKCPPEDLSINEEKVYVTDRSDLFVNFKQLCHGYKYQDGSAVEGQIIGRGSFIMRHLTSLDQETGKGKAGPGWTVGAQAVEILYDPHLYTYRLIRGLTVIDAGKVINPKTAHGVITGGMCMGFGLATREEFLYNNEGKLQDTSLRTYKLIRYGEQPKYEVEFVEEPQIDAPFGIRGIGEHGIIGIPAAFVNALSLATDFDFNYIPITPERIWQEKTGGKL